METLFEIKSFCFCIHNSYCALLYRVLCLPTKISNRYTYSVPVSVAGKSWQKEEIASPVGVPAIMTHMEANTHEAYFKVPVYPYSQRSWDYNGM